MTRGPRPQPALVVLALVGAAALVVWLARTDEDDRARVRSGPPEARAGRTTPVVDLAPPASSTIVAPRPAAVPPRAADGEVAPVRADERLAAPHELDPPPSIRGVRGLVRDARTFLPIAHAWLTWQPPGSTVVEKVLSRVGPDDVATGMITGADGRFDVDRLPDDERVSSTLYAVAAGYAVTGLRPGLQEEVVFDLVAMGGLEVRIAGLPPPERSRSPGDPPRPAREPPFVTIEPVPADPTRPTAFARIDEKLAVGRASHLAPGRWRVGFKDVAPTVVDIAAGSTAVVEIEIAPHRIDGTVVGTGSGCLLLADLDATDDDDRRHAFVLTDGCFQGELRPGRYRASLFLDEDGDGEDETERSLPGVVEVLPGETKLQLYAPQRGDKVQVILTRAGQSHTAGGLGLVALEGPNRGSLIALFPDSTRSGLHVGEAPAGRHALFEDDRLLVGDLALPAAGELVVATDSVRVALRFAVPSALRASETLRGRASLVPQALSGEVARRFVAAVGYSFRLTQDDPVLWVEIVAPGRYLLTGETDLGPFEAWVDLAPRVEVVVPLDE